MTEKERQAALDALSGLLGKQTPPPPGGGGNGPQITQDYADAWNKIMAKYDNDQVSIGELNDLLDQIKSGALTTLDA